MTWLSPAYPVGGYSYSHGLEWVVETGAVQERRDARRLDRGRAGARRRTHRRDLPGRGLAGALPAATCALLRAVAELAAAFAPSAERRLETLAQGTAFLTATHGGMAAAGAGAARRRTAREIGLPGRGRRLRGRARPAARRDGAGVRAGLRGQPGVGRRAPDPARADATACACSPRLEPLIPRWSPAALAASARRRRRRGGRGRHRLHAPRDAVHAAVPVMIARSPSCSSAVVYGASRCCTPYWGLGGHWPAASAERLAKTAVGTPGITRMPSRRIVLRRGGAAGGGRVLAAVCGADCCRRHGRAG